MTSCAHRKKIIALIYIAGWIIQICRSAFSPKSSNELKRAVDRYSECPFEPGGILLTPFTHRGVTFKNRIGLAPLTRGRASREAVSSKIMIQYYSERASSGFIISESAAISKRTDGWFRAPGIWTEEQVDAWRAVTDAVHKNGGKIYCQLWHMGRSAHSDLTGDIPLAPSAIPQSGLVEVADYQKKPAEVPKAMDENDIKTTLNDFKTAAQNALDAHFDGVQIHAANGYLIDQFLQSVTNNRTDEYGGSIQKRLRFLKEVIESVLTVCDANQVWVRFSPNGSWQDMGSPDNLEQFDAAIQLAASYKLGFVEVMDGESAGFHHMHARYTLERTRENVNKGNPDKENPTAVVGNTGYTLETANEEISAGHADMITFGRPYMSNPDLPERFAKGIALEPELPRQYWWKQAGPEGYIDIPKAT